LVSGFKSPSTDHVGIGRLHSNVPSQGTDRLCGKARGHPCTSLFKARIFRLILKRLCPGASGNKPEILGTPGPRSRFACRVADSRPSRIEQNKKGRVMWCFAGPIWRKVSIRLANPSASCWQGKSMETKRRMVLMPEWTSARPFMVGVAQHDGRYSRSPMQRAAQGSTAHGPVLSTKPKTMIPSSSAGEVFQKPRLPTRDEGMRLHPDGKPCGSSYPPGSGEPARWKVFSTSPGIRDAVADGRSRAPRLEGTAKGVAGWHRIALQRHGRRAFIVDLSKTASRRLILDLRDHGW